MVTCCRYHRNPNEDDIAQEYVMRLLKGLHAKATVEQAYIDIVRSVNGSTRSKSQQARVNLNNGGGVKDSEKILSLMEDQKDLTQDDLIDLKRYVNGVKSERTRFILNQRLVGFTLKEIADQLGVTQSYIQQILSKEFND